MTSCIMKARPPVNTTSSSINFAVGTANASRTPGGRPSWNDTSNVSLPSHEAFWNAVSVYYRFGMAMVDAGAMVFGYIYPRGNSSFHFSSSITLVGKTPAEAEALIAPLYVSLRSGTGFNFTAPKIRGSSKYGGCCRGPGGDRPDQTRYRSRIFPRRNWDDDDNIWNRTIAAIRKSVEAAGPEYNFHHIMHGPTRELAGWPGADSAVNPAWRNGLLHGSLMEKQPVGLTTDQALARDARAKQLTDLWRQVTPGSGAYMNEGDPAEPEWQKSFFGDNYPRLLQVKKAWDPWNLFWAPTTVGSEGWEVRVVDGYPHSQNGQLCRAGVEVPEEETAVIVQEPDEGEEENGGTEESGDSGESEEPGASGQSGQPGGEEEPSGDNGWSEDEGEGYEDDGQWSEDDEDWDDYEDEDDDDSGDGWWGGGWSGGRGWRPGRKL
jgi:hypothetical protein